MAEEPTVEPQASPEPSPPAKPPGGIAARWQRYKDWYLERKKWTIPASLLLIILILAGLPFSRYQLAGLALKRDVSLEVVDATAATPVSGATVSIGSLSAQTNGSGKATLHHIKVGNQTVLISKKYYKDSSVKLLNPILNQKTVPSFQLTATGRQVQVTVTNLINKQPLSNVDINVAGVSAKTDKSGSATIVLPVGTSQQKAHLSLSGYNDADVTIQVSNDKIQNNQFSLTPAGKVYFLSKLSGKIDVVKTNLDGSDRQTVLPGTGNEDNQNTVLLASRDWKYLALLSRRAGSSPSLYLIDTSNDALTTIDSGSADFNLNGWVGDSFVYTLTRSDVQLWQAGRQVIKSFDAVSKKLTTLDQTTASGSDSFDYLSQLVGDVYGYNGQVYYIMNWTAGLNSSDQLASKQATFNQIKPDGSGKKAIRSFGLASGATAVDVTLEERVESPSAIDLKFSDGTKDNFYVYANGQVKDDPSQTADSFYTADYPTYLQSPSGNQTFWAEPRDGKNTLFIGDQNGQNGQQIATLSDYFTYGWYTDNYLLVSKNSSELYTMDNTGKQTPVKISDYNKPVQTYAGYGGGYGGI